jgi:uncharacterized protein (UPF0335 family)
MSSSSGATKKRNTATRTAKESIITSSSTSSGGRGRSSTPRTTATSSAIDTESNASGTNTTDSSPTASAKWSRQQEKEQFSHLNDRLAAYIEKVRNLETENARLAVQIREVETTERKEKNNLSAQYEAKIADIRKQLDAITRNKAKLEIERAKAADGFNELKTRVGKLEKDLKASEVARNNALNNYNSINARLSNAENARDQAETENQALKGEVADLRKQLDVLHSQLEDEVVLRTELENKLGEKEEDLEFMRRTHSSQMEEVRRKRQVEMTSYTKDVENRYELKLQDQVQAMRAENDRRIAESRAEVEAIYKQKLADASAQSVRNSDAVIAAREEAARIRVRIVDLERSLENKEAKIAALTRSIGDLEFALGRARDEADMRVKQRNERIAQLEAENEEMTNDYHDLMDVKLQLDNELKTYQSLLEGEESRLNITTTPAPSPVGKKSSPSKATRSQQQQQQHVSFGSGGDVFSGETRESIRRGVKRRRIGLESEDAAYDFGEQQRTFKSNSHADGDLEVEEVSTDGRSVTLHNRGVDDLHIGGYTLKSLGGDKEVSFKFPSRQQLKADKAITIWSVGSGHTHNSPTDIVMKNQAWPEGDALRVELLDNESNVVAWREMLLEHGFQRIENGNGNPDRKR